MSRVDGFGFFFFSLDQYYNQADSMDFDISLIPAMPPPRGMASNFGNPESMDAAVLGVAVSTMVLMSIAVGIRIYTKAVILRDMRAEECKMALCVPRLCVQPRH